MHTIRTKLTLSILIASFAITPVMAKSHNSAHGHLDQNQVTSTRADLVTVNPQALSGPLPNPGIGIESFHAAWGETLTDEQYPQTGVEYYRFYWNELEPAEGEFNFALIDEALQQTRRTDPGMTLGLRFMALADPSEGTKVPQWLIDKGVKGNWVNNGQTFVPDLSDPLYQSYVQSFLNAIGEQYDGNPHISHVDIGMVGEWGEWHTSQIPEVANIWDKYSPETLNKYVDFHFTAFPHIQKVMLISGNESLAYATQKGAGWRADCWGDWHEFGDDWNHMQDDYPQRIAAATDLNPEFANSWQHAPVRFEMCGYMPDWLNVQNYSREQVQTSLDWALAQHASSLNLKSREVPSEYRDLVDNALEKLGYRFRLASLTHPQSVNPGETLTLDSVWFNDGVAPVYEPYHLVYRLVDMQGQAYMSAQSKVDLTTWLPGEHALSDSFTLNQDIPAGEYQIQVGILDEYSQPSIQLAIEGKTDELWYPVSSLWVN